MALCSEVKRRISLQSHLSSRHRDPKSEGLTILHPYALFTAFQTMYLCKLSILSSCIQVVSNTYNERTPLNTLNLEILKYLTIV